MIDLPYPPSTNRLWRSVRGRNILSEEGRQYRSEGLWVLQGIQATTRPAWPHTGRLSVTMTAYPPDNRRRDLDNLLKAVLDLLTHGGVYGDDSQIDRLTIQRGPVTPGGFVRVEITPFVQLLTHQGSTHDVLSAMSPRYAGTERRKP